MGSCRCCGGMFKTLQGCGCKKYGRSREILADIDIC